MTCQIAFISWTCKDKEEAKLVATQLLQEKLIACASLIPDVTSLYRWEGKIEESLECKVFLKTRASLFADVEKRIKELCSYKVPEIVQIPITNASSPYLSWLLSETSAL